jgi:dCTP deaminase
MDRRGGVWSDVDIQKALQCRDIVVEGYERRAIQPASLDIRLGSAFSWFRKRKWYESKGVIDPSLPVAPLMQTSEQEDIALEPCSFMLGVSKEKITLGNSVVARVEGKSSLGRIGLTVHATAGYIDPGFSGYITLELFNQSPYRIQLIAGMWIAQLSFQYTQTAGHSYKGRYQDQKIPVPVASRIEQNVG